MGPGSRLDGYELVRLLGAGGMGEVWSATDLHLGRKVAIKLLPAALTSDPVRVARFEQEARAASSLNHPNVCTIHALGQGADGQRFIAMELVDGHSLRERLSMGALPRAELLSNRHTDCGGADGLACGRCRPSGSEARERDAAFRRPRQGRRLRPREAHRLWQRFRVDDTVTGPHDAGRRCRHRDVHVSGAGARACCRRAHRCLVPWGHLVRDARGASAVHRRDGNGYPRSDSRNRACAHGVGFRRFAGAATDHRQGAQEGSRAALPGDERPGAAARPPPVLAADPHRDLGPVLFATMYVAGFVAVVAA